MKQLENSNNVIQRIYYERKRGKPTGRTIALLRRGRDLYFGFSKCNLKKEPCFRKSVGRRIALTRANFLLRCDEGLTNGRHDLPKQEYGLHTQVHLTNDIPRFIPEWLYKFPSEMG